MPETRTPLASSHGVFATQVVREVAAHLGLALDDMRGTGPGRRITLRDLARVAGGLPASLEPDPTRADSAQAHASPAARNLATDLGVDLGGIVGSAPGGRIRMADVRTARTAAPSQVAPGSSLNDTGVGVGVGVQPQAGEPVRGSAASLAKERAELARPTVTSLQHSTQLTTCVIEVDVTNPCRAPRHAMSEDGGPGQRHVAPYVAEALGATLRDHPVLNARIDPDGGQMDRHLNLGIALTGQSSAPHVLVADADTLDAAGIAIAILATTDASSPSQERVADEMAEDVEPSFTLSLEPGDILFGTPLIPFEHTATLSLGAVRKRPMVMVDSASTEVVAVRHCAYLSMTYDHRLMDRADAASFMSDLRARIERASTST